VSILWRRFKESYWSGHQEKRLRWKMGRGAGPLEKGEKVISCFNLVTSGRTVKTLRSAGGAGVETVVDVEGSKGHVEGGKTVGPRGGGLVKRGEIARDSMGWCRVRGGGVFTVVWRSAQDGVSNADCHAKKTGEGKSEASHSGVCHGCLLEGFLCFFNHQGRPGLKGVSKHLIRKSTYPGELALTD